MSRHGRTDKGATQTATDAGTASGPTALVVAGHDQTRLAKDTRRLMFIRTGGNAPPRAVPTEADRPEAELALEEAVEIVDALWLALATADQAMAVKVMEWIAQLWHLAAEVPIPTGRAEIWDPMETSMANAILDGVSSSVLGYVAITTMAGIDDHKRAFKALQHSSWKERSIEMGSCGILLTQDHVPVAMRDTVTIRHA